MTLNATAAKLLMATQGCRPDMHEPDEQGIREVTLVGNHLDNAFGDTITVDAITKGYQEYVLVIHRDAVFEPQPINLATLIALARIGAQKVIDEVEVD